MATAGRMTEDSNHRPAGVWLDGLVVGASAACLVHCLALPLLFALVPPAAAVLGVPHEFHLALFALAVPASAVALCSGYRRHGMVLPAALGTLGILLLGLGALAGFRIAAETGLTVAGGFLLAAGHLRNWRLQKAS